MLSNIKILFGLMIVVSGLAYYVSQSDSNQSSTAEFLMPTWQDNNAAIEAVTEVRLNQGEQTIQIKKVAGHWVLDGGFYVNLAPLSELMQSLQAAEIVEAKTANPANHQQLALADEDLNVEIYHDETLISQIHLGKSASSGMVFVRRVDENQSYLVKNLKPVVFKVDHWQLKTVLDIPANEVMAIEFKPSDGEGFKVQRNPADMSLVIADMPAGFELKDNAGLNVFVSGLTRLLIDDALPLDLAEKTLKQTNTYQLTDATELTIKLYQQEEGFYLTIGGENYSQYQNWMMKLAGYKFEALSKQAADVIEPVSVEGSTNE